MLIGYKRGQGSIVLRVKILNSSVSTGAGLTGLTNASTGLIISTIADNEATATAYTVAASNVETITTLGTYAAPTAGKCRFKEVDATNHKGVYEIHLADARYAVSSAKSLLVSVLGATNAAETDVVIPLRDLDPYDGTAGGLSRLDAAVSSRMATYTQPTGFLAATFPTTVASTTNITAGTITTVSGNVSGNVVGSVGSVTAAVTVGTNNDKTGYSLTQAFPPNFASLGINSSGHVSRVTLVDTTTTNTDMRGTDNAALAASWTSTRAGYLDSVLLAQNANQRTVQVTGSNHVAADMHESQPGSIHATTFDAGAIDAAALAADAANEIADALLDRANAIETGLSVRGAFRLSTAALVGKLSGAATTTVTIRNVGDTKARVTATVDADGNRTAVTTDAT